MPDYTVADLIQRHQELRAYIDEEQAKLDVVLTPYKDGLVALNAAIAAELHAQGVQNFKTEHGTAFQRRTNKAKVADREAFVSFAIENRQFISNTIPAETINTWMDEHDSPPPGVEIETSVSCVIRKAT